MEIAWIQNPEKRWLGNRVQRREFGKTSRNSEEQWGWEARTQKIFWKGQGYYWSEMICSWHIQMESSSPSSCLLLKRAVPSQTRGSYSSALLTPQHLLVPLTILVHCLLLDLSLGLPLPSPAKKKGELYGRTPKIFCILLQDKAKLFLAPLRTNQIYFFSFFLLQSPVSGRFHAEEWKLELPFSMPWQFLLSISFVCLPLADCLLCLRVVDFFQRLLSSQGK